MVTPLQFGIPFGSQLAVLALLAILIGIPAIVGFWISRDVKRRGSDHHVAWGLMAFLTGLVYVLPVLIFLAFYLTVREDVGETGLD